MNPRFLFLLTFFLAAHAQVPSFSQVSWTRKADFPSSSRNNGVGFTIGKKGYYGLGEKQVKLFAYKVYNDFWEYDPAKDTWTQKADFPGGGRISARGFSANGKGYAGFGYLIILEGPEVGMNNYQSDLYEYDPADNAWFKKKGQPMGDRDVCFVLNDTICSVNAETRTLKKYCPASDTWTEYKWEKKETSPYYMTVTGNDGFLKDGKACIITVAKEKRKFVNELWEFDPHSLAWNKKGDLPSPGSEEFTVFGAGKKEYVMRKQNDFLEFDPASGSWNSKKEIPLPEPDFSYAFTVDGKGYGFSKHQFWEFAPQP